MSGETEGLWQLATTPEGGGVEENVPLGPVIYPPGRGSYPLGLVICPPGPVIYTFQSLSFGTHFSGLPPRRK